MGNVYIGSSGNKKIKNAWIGTPSGSKKVKAIWIGTPQGNRKVWTSAFAFTYTGNYVVTGDLSGDFAITFLTGGTLTITSLGKAEAGLDVCCVAGGRGGARGDYAAWRDPDQPTIWYYHAMGGDGGAGGKVTNGSITAYETSYSVTVGGVGAASNFNNQVVASGTGAAGGNGGNKGVSGNAATAGGNGTYAFNDPYQATNYAAGTRFGAGGGGGFGWNSISGSFEPKSGGTSGGGQGGYGQGRGYDATIPGSGGGGGGGSGKVQNQTEGKQNAGNGGNGLGGVVIIRNKR